MFLTLTIDDALANFFDRRRIIDSLDATAAQGASRWGAYVRRTARTSIRKARRQRLTELTPDERRRFRIREEYAQRQGRPKPKLPFLPSEPGEPPRSVTGLLKDFLFFAYDPQRRSVVVGPAKLNGGSGAPQILEEGGFATFPTGKRVYIRQREYMGPAFEKNIHHLPRMLALGK